MSVGQRDVLGNLSVFPEKADSSTMSSLTGPGWFGPALGEDGTGAKPGAGRRPPLDSPATAGAPQGRPVTSPQELLTAFVNGGPAGSTEVWHVEGALLTGRHTPLAIRVGAAVLVRTELPGGFTDLLAALEQALGDAGLRRIEARTVLGHVIGIEVAGVRGSEWDLWATDAETGHEVLKQRALGEIAEHIDPDEPARRAREEESLQRIERNLWP